MAKEVDLDIVNSFGISHKISSIQKSYEEELIAEEKTKLFWKYIETVKNHDLLYDYYVNEMLYKELAVKYFNNGEEYSDDNKYSSDLATVKNRIFAGKKFLKRKIKAHEKTIKSLIQL